MLQLQARLLPPTSAALASADQAMKVLSRDTAVLDKTCFLSHSQLALQGQGGGDLDSGGKSHAPQAKAESRPEGERMVRPVGFLLRLSPLSPGSGACLLPSLEPVSWRDELSCPVPLSSGLPPSTVLPS